MIEANFQYTPLPVYMRSTLVSLQDVRCLINVLMELKKPFLELISNHERIKDILPKKPGDRDPNVKDNARLR